MSFAQKLTAMASTEEGAQQMCKHRRSSNNCRQLLADSFGCGQKSMASPVSRELNDEATRLWKCWTSCSWRKERRRASSCGGRAESCGGRAESCGVCWAEVAQGQSQSSEESSKRQRLVSVRGWRSCSIVLPFSWVPLYYVFLEFIHCTTAWVYSIVLSFFLRCSSCVASSCCGTYYPGKKIIKDETFMRLIHRGGTVMNFSAVTIFFGQDSRNMRATNAPTLTMSWRHRTKLHRRSWSRVGWLRVCIVKWCRERRKEVESRPRIATQPNESASNGAKMWISFAVFQGKASPFSLIEFSHCITVPEFIQCNTVYPLYYRLSNCIIVFLEFIHYNSWLAFWQSFKRSLLTKARRKDLQKSSDISVYNTINREEIKVLLFIHCTTVFHEFTPLYYRFSWGVLLALRHPVAEPTTLAKKSLKLRHSWDWSTVEEPHEFLGCNDFFGQDSRPPPLICLDGNRTKLHRRSWSRVGWLRVCIVKRCRERRKEVESRPRIAT